MPYSIDQKKFPFCYSGWQYATDVLSGKQIACKFIIGACQRFLNDLENPKFFFDIQYAEKYLRLVQKFEHIIGNWDSKTIVYMPWQNFLWMNIMGFKNADTLTRRFRIAHIEVARGNSKSTQASQAVLFFLALDNPKGNQISTVATRKEQARIVLDAARAMARKASSYRAKTSVKVLAHSIIHDKSDSKVRALSSDHSGLDGLQDILAVCDELHAMKRETFDVVYSGMSKRKDSLTLCITTAGFDIESVGFSQSFYAKKVATGEVEDDQFFAAVFTLDEKDDIYDPKNWIKANPGYGDSVDPVTFEAKAKKAMETPSDVANFKVKHLNIWLSEARAYYDMEKWDACADPNLKFEDFIGKKCIMALDLSSKVDLTSVGYVFEMGDKFAIFDKSFIPEETVKQLRSSLYENAIGNGHLIQTTGEAIHYPKIKEVILEDNKKFKIEEILYDPWNATHFSQELTEHKIEAVEFRFNTANLSEPTKHLDALMRQGKLVHNGSPVLRWAVGNVVCKEDAAGNIFPRKNHEKLKIDPVISIIMALASWMQKKRKKSIYESRGIRTM